MFNHVVYIYSLFFALPKMGQAVIHRLDSYFGDLYTILSLINGGL